MAKARAALLLLTMAGCIAPFADVRLMDHKTGDQRSSADLGVSIVKKRSVVDVAVATDFDLGGQGGGSPIGRALYGFRVTWRGR